MPLRVKYITPEKKANALIEGHLAKYHNDWTMTFFNGRRSKKTRDYNNLSMMLYETETETETERGI